MVGLREGRSGPTAYHRACLVEQLIKPLAFKHQVPPCGPCSFGWGLLSQNPNSLHGQLSSKTEQGARLGYITPAHHSQSFLTRSLLNARCKAALSAWGPCLVGILEHLGDLARLGGLAPAHHVLGSDHLDEGELRVDAQRGCDSCLSSARRALQQRCQ